MDSKLDSIMNICFENGNTSKELLKLVKVFELNLNHINKELEKNESRSTFNEKQSN